MVIASGDGDGNGADCRRLVVPEKCDGRWRLSQICHNPEFDPVENVLRLAYFLVVQVFSLQTS